jgi:hypothetical protein
MSGFAIFDAEMPLIQSLKVKNFFVPNGGVVSQINQRHAGVAASDA